MKGTKPIKVTNSSNTLSTLSVITMLAGALDMNPTVFYDVAGLVVDSLNMIVEGNSSYYYVYVDYTFLTYSGCSILTGKNNLKILFADQNNGVWSRGETIVDEILGGWYWTGDPANYSYPASCRVAVTTYKYYSGAFKELSDL